MSETREIGTFPEGDERCDNCKFSVDIKTDPPKSFGNYICRRFPPINVHVIGETALDESLMPRILARAAQVPVNHNWWCGEWKPRVTN